MNKRQGALITAALGALVLTAGCASTGGHHSSSTTGKCYDVNKCKGTGACGAEDGSYSCAGQNACKGHGWLSMTKADCDAKGGRFGS